jgi:hypothetical protein
MRFALLYNMQGKLLFYSIFAVFGQCFCVFFWFFLFLGESPFSSTI